MLRSFRIDVMKNIHSLLSLPALFIIIIESYRWRSERHLQPHCHFATSRQHRLPLLSIGILIDSNIGHSPSLATIAGNKVASSTSKPKSLAVIGIGNVHDQRGVEIVMLRDGAALRLLTFHGWW